MLSGTGSERPEVLRCDVCKTVIEGNAWEGFDFPLSARHPYPDVFVSCLRPECLEEAQQREKERREEVYDEDDEDNY